MRPSRLKPVPISLHLGAGTGSISVSYAQAWNIIKLRRHFQARYSQLSVSGTAGDGRARLSKLWAPSGGIAPSESEDSHSMLVRAGFLRQAHSGLFHMLPLGKRVQDKLEALIEKYMSKLGASKLDLSSISSEALWAASGRLQSIGSELFRFRDRKEARYLLSPTHEEEITSLVSNATASYKDLPVRLYQISRKYRDELRPRHGLLRSREFTMKDLYTFDYSLSQALSTYNQVRQVYAQLFDELRLPYVVAEADSGDMGGNLSHEFHFPTSKGEDHVISCSSCEYVANEELADGPVLPSELDSTDSVVEPTGDELDLIRKTLEELPSWKGISKDKFTFFIIRYSPSALSSSIPERQINNHALKATFPEIDFAVEDPLALWLKSAQQSTTQDSEAPAPLRRVIHIIDGSVPDKLRKILDSTVGNDLLPSMRGAHRAHTILQHPQTRAPLNLLSIANGDRCPRCSKGHLKVNRAIELGHTFHLGSRYTKELGGHVTAPKEITRGHEMDFEFLPTTKGSKSDSQVVVQMGCHGIGVSRMIGAVADTLADERGLNWPRVMAPFEAIIVASKGLEDAALEVYDTIAGTPRQCQEPHIDLVLDDRTKPFPWKMHDADLVGYPIIVVVGRAWHDKRMCEVQCRRLKIIKEVPLQELQMYIRSLLEML